MPGLDAKVCLTSLRNGIFPRSKPPVVTSLFIFLALGFSTPKGCHLSRPASPPPNIVLIFTDDQGYQDVGCFGAQGFSTPNLDQMARDGIRLTNFYVAQPVCSASRAALLTGCYSSRVDMHHALMPRAKKGLNLRETTIAEMLKAHGYATACFDKWHLGDNPEFMPLRQGFDEYFGIPYSNDMWPIHPNPGMRKEFPWLPLYEGEKTVDSLHDQTMLTTWVTEHAVSFIDRHRSQPFFLYVPHPMPHVPLFVSDKFRGKSAKGLYGDVIMEIDWSVGEILAALRRNGLEENTLVIFTSDNGPWLAYGNHAGSALPLREGKGTVWEGGVREPFIMQWKGHLPAGAVINEPLMTIDLLPTIARVTGAPLPDLPIDGRDAWPVLTLQAGATSPHEAYFFYYETNELQAMRSGRWKLYFPHTYRSIGQTTGGRDGQPGPYASVKITEPELYDLATDISETRNVAAEHPDVVRRLEALAETARADLGDALTGRTGSGVRPAGRVSD